ncbi:hypothetical protein BDC45DRAFT_498379 [Circinella umbellata]|nr:hypothetical protein BDC45DRAFT_498379 [Circinella umbellata]
MFPCDPVQQERILKMLSEKNVIDIIAKTLVNVYEGTYSLSSTLNVENGILATYIACREIDNALPPIILHIQPNLCQDGMTTAVNQCLQIYQQYHQLPVILLITSNKLTDPFFAPFKPVPDKSDLYFLPNAAWCGTCFLLSNNFDNGIIHQEDELSSLPNLFLEGNYSSSKT